MAGTVAGRRGDKAEECGAARAGTTTVAFRAEATGPPSGRSVSASQAIVSLQVGGAHVPDKKTYASRCTLSESCHMLASEPSQGWCQETHPSVSTARYLPPASSATP